MKKKLKKELSIGWVVLVILSWSLLCSVGGVILALRSIPTPKHTVCVVIGEKKLQVEGDRPDVKDGCLVIKDKDGEINSIACMPMSPMFADKGKCKDE